MPRKNTQWLIGELPRLVQRNLISEAQQAAIADFYTQESRNRPNIALITFSIFGAILLAGGIILLLAHNWSDLPRSLRTVLSFLPLVAGQGLGLWTLFKRNDSIAWCEGVAAFTFLAIGSTIALISQTYHIQGDLRTFLFTWMLCALPLVYVFRSTTSAVFYLAGISTWAIAAAFSCESNLAYWPLFFGIIPIFLIKYKGGAHPKQAAILGWFLALSLIAGVSVGFRSITEGFRAITFLSLFISLYIIDELFEENRVVVSKPFHVVGILGLSATCIFLSYRGSWEHFSYHVADWYGRSLKIGWGDWAVSLGFPLLALCLLAFALQRKNRVAMGMALGLPLALVGFAFTGTPAGQSIFTALFNLYVFAGGIACLVFGIRNNIGTSVNYGFVLIAALVVLRFFDAELNFILRGIIFVVLGIGFLSTNLIIAKRRAV